MEKHKEVKKRLLPLLERHEPIFLDSSAIQTYKDCARKYFYQYVLAKVPNEPFPPLYFGSAYHKFRETLSLKWFEHRERGGTLSDFSEANLLFAINQALQTYDKEGKGREPGEKDRYFFLTKARLGISCRVAYQHWLNEIKTNAIEVLQVEVPGNFEYANGNRKTFRVDELIKWNGKLWIRDFKASSVLPGYYKNQLMFKDQPYTYIIGLSRITQKEIKGILYEQMYNDKGTKEKMAGPEIHSHPIQFTHSQLENWEHEQSFIHDSIKRSRELDIYPMHENEYKCNKCNYKEICSANNQNQMYAVINSKFRTNIWNNAEIIDG